MAKPPQDDHLPPPPSASTRAESTLPPAAASGPGRWGDRALFLAAGLVLGFTMAYVYLDKTKESVPAAAVDPHAGLPGFNPGATRDMPDGAGSTAGGGSMPPAGGTSTRERLRELEEAVAKDPNNYDLLVLWGNACYDAEQFSQAIVAYERAVKIKSSDANVLTDLGVCYRNTGKPDKALELFSRALSVDPKHGPALFNTAIVYGVDKGDVARAREVLARLKKEHPEIPSLDRLEKMLQERSGGKSGS